MNEIMIEVRKCQGCELEFKVLSKSLQKYHSKYCEDLHQGSEGASPLKVPSSAEAYYIETGKRPGIGKDIEPMKIFDKKNAISGSEKGKDTKNVLQMTQNLPQEKKSGSEKIIVPDTNETVKKKTPEDSNGPSEIKNDNLNTKGNIMQKTESDSNKSSLKPVIVEDQQSDLQNFSESLKQEKLTSMNLINDSTKQLQKVMNSICERNKDNPMRTINSADVHDITSIATSMIGLLQVKVAAMKVAAEFLKGEK